MRAGLRTPSKKLKGGGEVGPPDVTPIMNLVVVLIPVLLSMAAFTKIALLEYLPPAQAEAGAGGGIEGQEDQSEEADQKLGLIVNLLPEEIQISIFNQKDGVNFRVVSAPGGAYNWNALTDSLLIIKKDEVGEANASAFGVDSVITPTGELSLVPRYKFTDGRDVSLTAHGQAMFQDIVFAMDACRRHIAPGDTTELFPNTALKTFE
ncbi:MAG: hypothetical protein P9M15_08085 [Candidatus Electryoneaceae bacterium]|nr:hypothetical protein [Candidatus Electryoneaceae bacterium]